MDLCHPKIWVCHANWMKLTKKMCSSIPIRGNVSVGFNLWEGTHDVLKSKMATFLNTVCFLVHSISNPSIFTSNNHLCSVKKIWDQRV